MSILGLKIYGQIHASASRSSLGLRPRELLQAEGYIWPYIPPLVLIRIQLLDVVGPVDNGPSTDMLQTIVKTSREQNAA